MPTVCRKKRRHDYIRWLTYRLLGDGFNRIKFQLRRVRFPQDYFAGDYDMERDAAEGLIIAYLESEGC